MVKKLYDIRTYSREAWSIEAAYGNAVQVSNGEYLSRSRTEVKGA